MRPSTCETRCMTCEYRSTVSSSGTLTDPYAATRPMSLRSRSTSIICSAISFSLPRSSASMAASSAGVSPRRRVPAMGRVLILSPCSLTSSSGDALESANPGERSSPIYGDGLSLRSHS
ncbi:hypothetical protein D3C80_1741050 [compost metagenome]